jgi:hypothetical protein
MSEIRSSGRQQKAVGVHFKCKSYFQAASMAHFILLLLGGTLESPWKRSNYGEKQHLQLTSSSFPVVFS